VDVRRVPLDFHARFQAKERTYVGNWTHCRAENLNDLLVLILTCLWGFFPSNLSISIMFWPDQQSNWLLQMHGLVLNRYHYRILAGTGLLSVFEKDRAWHVPEELDLADMQVCPLISPHL
jgi:tRNA U38,U39,U40 pseudouridine synthase TruA